MKIITDEQGGEDIDEKETKNDHSTPGLEEAYDQSNAKRSEDYGWEEKWSSKDKFSCHFLGTTLVRLSLLICLTFWNLVPRLNNEFHTIPWILELTQNLNIIEDDGGWKQRNKAENHTGNMNTSKVVSVLWNVKETNSRSNQSMYRS